MIQRGEHELWRRVPFIGQTEGMGDQHAELSQYSSPVFRVHMDRDGAKQGEDIHPFHRKIRSEQHH